VEVIGGSESFEVDVGTMEKVLGEADTDGDGKINFQEFVNLMNE
jgi:Ca2+-binding EF-hand superfamily protein